MLKLSPYWRQLGLIIDTRTGPVPSALIIHQKDRISRSDLFTCGLWQKFQSSIAFHVLLFCNFVNSRGRRKNKNTWLEPFSEKDHQNFSTIRTGLLAMPHDLQGVEGKNRNRSPLQYLFKEKDTNYIASNFLWRGSLIIRRFLLFESGGVGT